MYRTPGKHNVNIYARPLALGAAGGALNAGLQIADKGPMRVRPIGNIIPPHMSRFPQHGLNTNLQRAFPQGDLNPLHMDIYRPGSAANLPVGK